MDSEILNLNLGTPSYSVCTMKKEREKMKGEAVAIVVEHMAMVDVMITYSTNDKSETIFESVYWSVHDVVSLPPIDCLACRLEETKDKSARSWG